MNEMDLDLLLADSEIERLNMIFEKTQVNKFSKKDDIMITLDEYNKNHIILINTFIGLTILGILI